MALEHALKSHLDADITVLYVADSVDAGSYTELTGNPSEHDDRYREDAEAVFAEADALAGEHDRTVTTELSVGKPARTIIEFAEMGNIDHIVIGSHGRSGASRILLGSVAERVVRRAPVPVTVVR